MDQMCPNWPKNEVFVSFLKFKPSDSADFAYSSSFLLSWTTIATKLAEKNLRLKIRPSPNYFNGFWLFSHVFFIGNRWFCTFKLFSTVFIYLLSIWVVKIFWASKFSCLQIIFCLQITIFAFYLCNLLNNTHDCFLAYLLSFFLCFFLS